MLQYRLLSALLKPQEEACQFHVHLRHADAASSALSLDILLVLFAKFSLRSPTSLDHDALQIHSRFQQNLQHHELLAASLHSQAPEDQNPGLPTAYAMRLLISL